MSLDFKDLKQLFPNQLPSNLVPIPPVYKITFKPQIVRQGERNNGTINKRRMKKVWEHIWE